ncbi:MAG: hypothetical protein ACKO4S_17925 [Snowella sp.]
MKGKHPKMEIPSHEGKFPKIMMLHPQTSFRHQSRGVQQGRNRPR